MSARVGGSAARPGTGACSRCRTRSPSAGNATAAIAIHPCRRRLEAVRHVDGYYRPLARGGHDVHRQVVEDAAVDEHAGAVAARGAPRGPAGSCWRLPLATAARGGVRPARRWAGRPRRRRSRAAGPRSAWEVAGQHRCTRCPRISEWREPVVVERIPPHPLLVAARVDLVRLHPDREHRADEGAHRAAAHAIDHEAGCEQLLEGPDVSEGARPAARQHQAGRAAGEAARRHGDGRGQRSARAQRVARARGSADGSRRCGSRGPSPSAMNISSQSASAGRAARRARRVARAARPTRRQRSASRRQKSFPVVGRPPVAGRDEGVGGDGARPARAPARNARAARLRPRELERRHSRAVEGANHGAPPAQLVDQEHGRSCRWARRRGPAPGRSRTPRSARVASSERLTLELQRP